MRISDWSSDVCSSDLTDSTDSSVELARQTVIDHGALSLAAYATDETVLEQVRKAAEQAGVSLSLNLTRSDERRVGKECVSTCRSRWSQYHSKKKRRSIIQ